MAKDQGKKPEQDGGIGGDRAEMTAIGGTIGDIPPVEGEPSDYEIELFAEEIGAARNGTTSIFGITDSVMDAGPDASASDVLGVLHREMQDLPTGEAQAVSGMTGRLHTIEEGEERNVGDWTYINTPSGNNVRLRIAWDAAMKPSDSTSILVRNMRITPGERLLDLGTGTGVIAIAAHKLGAGAITATDLCNNFANEIRVNLRMNWLRESERAAIDLRFGDMFVPVDGELFDHVIMNPPSIPCQTGTHLDVHYDSGPEGRGIIDRLLNEVLSVLKPGGRFTMVHGSLSNLPRTLQLLRLLGFTNIDMSPIEEFPFKDFYPVDYLKSLKDKGMSEFREVPLPDGGFEYRDMRVVLTALSPIQRP